MKEKISLIREDAYKRVIGMLIRESEEISCDGEEDMEEEESEEVYLAKGTISKSNEICHMDIEGNNGEHYEYESEMYDIKPYYKFTGQIRTTERSVGGMVTDSKYVSYADCLLIRRIKDGVEVKSMLSDKSKDNIERSMIDGATNAMGLEE